MISIGGTASPSSVLVNPIPVEPKQPFTAPSPTVMSSGPTIQAGSSGPSATGTDKVPSTTPTFSSMLEGPGVWSGKALAVWGGVAVLAFLILRK